VNNENIFKKFVNWQAKELELFKAKCEVYGSAYWEEDSTLLERYFGGLQRKDTRLKNFAKTGAGEKTESLQDCLIDIGVYSKMELIKQELLKNGKQSVQNSGNKKLDEKKL